MENKSEMTISPLILNLQKSRGVLPIYTLKLVKPHIFLDRLLMGVAQLFFVPSNFVHSVAQTSRKTLLSFDSHFNSLCCCSFTIFCKWMKIFLGV